MNRNLKMRLISLLPLIFLLGLLPMMDFVNKKLLFGVEFVLLGLLILKYRKELIDWRMEKIKEDRERWRKTFSHRDILLIILCFGMGVFLLLNYVLGVFNK